MFVQAVLLMREGLKHFDPGSDLLVNLRQPAQFLTWRKQGQTWSHNKVRFEKLPYGSGVVGAFLSDVFGNISYAGYIDGQPGNRVRDYIEYVLPKVNDSYTHTRYNKLFAPPVSNLDLLDKLHDINWLYYGVDDRPCFNYSPVSGWEIHFWQGIVEIHLPRELSSEQLAEIYLKIIDETRPKHSYMDVTKPVYNC